MSKLIATKTIGTEDIHVSWKLEGSDLSFRGGVCVPHTHNKLADRLCRAIEAGVVVKNIQEKTDIYGNAYLGGDFSILMRTANADLKRLGF